MTHLRAEDAEAFARDGFLGPIDVLSPDETARVRDAVAEVIARLDELEPQLYEVERAHRERPDEVVCHFLGGWRVSPVLRELVFDPRIVEPCAQLLGVERLRFWHDQVFAKPPGHPGVVPWHQDYSYLTRTQPCRHITLNLMLDEADEQSGCVQFLPGSHRWGLFEKLPFDAPFEALRAGLPATAEWRPVAAPLRPGQATIHHGCTLHGRGPTRSARWRRAVVLNSMAADVRVADGDAPLLKGAAPLAVGAVVEGELFPIVWPR